MYNRFLATVAAADVVDAPRDPAPVTEADLVDLPDAVQRYLRFMGVVGRVRDWSFRARFSGRFAGNPTSGGCPVRHGVQRKVTSARIFYMRARFGHLVPMVARDTYVRGHGRMLGKLFDLITVVDGAGEEFDIGELVTFLNDAVLLAPSMLLGPNTTWSEVDDDAFDVTLTDAGRTVTGRVLVDEQGAPSDFSTTDHFAALSKGLVRAQWTTSITSWTVSNGRPLPAGASAVWHLPEGPFSYIQGRYTPGDLTYDVAPSG
jgi:hypothetical protein